MSHLQKITFVEMREIGAHDVLIYCRDHRCSHHVETTADGWGDDVRLGDIETSSPAAPAASAVPRSGRNLVLLGWALPDTPGVAPDGVFSVVATFSRKNTERPELACESEPMALHS
jgi:hypothetical protein